jgi:hypothetical protein
MVFLAPDNRSGDPPERKPLPLSPAVWVRLDAVLPHPADARQTSVPEGLDLVGNAAGWMRPGSWVRSARGMWLALCSFDIPYADGRQTYRVADQLVPGYALQLRPRDRD